MNSSAINNPGGNDELANLTTIRNTMAKYAAGLEQIKALKQDQATINIIDQQVKISDDDALYAQLSIQ